MALTNVTSSGGYLLSLRQNSSAVSEPRTQQLIDTDYRKTKNSRIRWLLGNIGTSSFTVDTLTTSHNVEEGDLLIIQKPDQSFGEMIIPVGGTTPTQNASLVPTMISNSLPYGNCFTNVGTAYYAFDYSPDTKTSRLSAAQYVGYQFYGNEPKTVYAVYLKGTRTYSGLDFVIEGSTNGLDYTVLYTGTNQGNDVYAGMTFTLTTTGSYSFYRYRTTDYYVDIQEMRLFGDGVSIDTSSVTAGGTPNRTYSHNDNVNINNVQLVERNRDYSYGDSADRLEVYSQYEDCVWYPSREIVTTYDFKVAGNMMLEQTDDIYDLWLKQGNATMTDNTSPRDSVALSGTFSPVVAADAWKIFDGDDTTESYSVTTGTGGACDFTHTYEFDTPTTCYAIRMTTSNFTQAPAEYKVEASFDGTSYVELLHITQGIAANDLTLTKYFDITKYDAYKFYRVQVLKGNTENDAVTAKQYVFLEEDPS